MTHITDTMNYMRTWLKYSGIRAEGQLLNRIQEFAFPLTGCHTKVKYSNQLFQSAGALEYTDCISAKG